MSLERVGISSLYNVNFLLGYNIGTVISLNEEIV